MVTSEETAGQLILKRERRDLEGRGRTRTAQNKNVPMERKRGKHKEKWIKKFKASGMGAWHKLAVSSRQAVMGSNPQDRKSATELSGCPLEEAKGEKAPFHTPILARSSLLLSTAHCPLPKPLRPSQLCRGP